MEPNVSFDGVGTYIDVEESVSRRAPRGRASLVLEDSGLDASTDDHLAGDADEEEEPSFEPLYDPSTMAALQTPLSDEEEDGQGALPQLPATASEMHSQMQASAASDDAVLSSAMGSLAFEPLYDPSTLACLDLAGEEWAAPALGEMVARAAEAEPEPAAAAVPAAAPPRSGVQIEDKRGDPRGYSQVTLMQEPPAKPTRAQQRAPPPLAAAAAAPAAPAPAAAPAVAPVDVAALPWWDKVAHFNDFLKCPWYYGEIDRAAAELLVVNCKPGTYLIRVSRKNHGYAITTSTTARGGVLHLLVKYLDADGIFSLDGVRFGRLQDIIDFYTRRDYNGLVTLSGPIPRPAHNPAALLASRLDDNAAAGPLSTTPLSAASSTVTSPSPVSPNSAPPPPARPSQSHHAPARPAFASHTHQPHGPGPALPPRDRSATLPHRPSTQSGGAAAPAPPPRRSLYPSGLPPIDSNDDGNDYVEPSDFNQPLPPTAHHMHHPHHSHTLPPEPAHSAPPPPPRNRAATLPVRGGFSALAAQQDIFDDEHDYEDPDTVRHQSEYLRRREKLKSTRAAPLPPNPLTWNPGEVLRFLKENDLGDFHEVFYSNGFAGKQLLALRSESFAKGGFSKARCDALGAAITRLRDVATKYARRR